MLGHSQRWKNEKRRVLSVVKNIKHPHLISKTILPKPPIETSSTSQAPEPQNLHRLPTSYPRNEPRQQSMNLPQKVSHLGRTTLYCSLHQPPTTIVSRSRDEEWSKGGKVWVINHPRTVKRAIEGRPKMAVDTHRIAETAFWLPPRLADSPLALAGVEHRPFPQKASPSCGELSKLGWMLCTHAFRANQIARATSHPFSNTFTLGSCVQVRLGSLEALRYRVGTAVIV